MENYGRLLYILLFTLSVVVMPITTFKIIYESQGLLIWSVATVGATTVAAAGHALLISFGSPSDYLPVILFTIPIPTFMILLVLVYELITNFVYGLALCALLTWPAIIGIAYFVKVVTIDDNISRIRFCVIWLFPTISTVIATIIFCYLYNKTQPPAYLVIICSLIYPVFTTVTVSCYMIYYRTSDE